MSDRAHARGGERPLVAVLYRVPLVCEAIVAALDPIVSTSAFPAGVGDLLGLLDSVSPDAIVVDSVEAGEIALYARVEEVPMVQIDLRAQQLLIFERGDLRTEETVTAESVRNAVAGALFGLRAVPT